MTEDYGELTPSALGQLEVTLDTDPDTGQPAVCFAFRWMDEGSMVACVWYTLEGMRVVAQQVAQVLAELEQITEQEKDNENVSHV